MKTNLKRISQFKSNFSFPQLSLLCVLMIGAPLTSEASASQQSKASFGKDIKLAPTLGFNYLNISDAKSEGNSIDYKSKGGNSIGVTAQLPLADQQLLVETGLEYMESSSKLSAEYGIFSLEYQTLKMSHLAIPLRAKYLFSDAASSDTRFYAKGGLMPTLLLSAKTKTLDGETDSKSDMNSLGLYAQAGIGGDWATSFYNGRVSVDLMYNYGLTKVFKEEGGRSSGLSLIAGYIIEL